MINALGSMMATGSLHAMKTEIDVSSLPGGIYFLQLTTLTNQRMIEKIIIE